MPGNGQQSYLWDGPYFPFISTRVSIHSECEWGPTEHPASLQESKAALIPVCPHMCHWHSQETR